MFLAHHPGTSGSLRARREARGERFALQHFGDKAILLKKELGALQSVKHEAVPALSPSRSVPGDQEEEEEAVGGNGNRHSALHGRLRASHK